MIIARLDEVYRRKDACNSEMDLMREQINENKQNTALVVQKVDDIRKLMWLLIGGVAGEIILRFFGMLWK